MTATSRLGRWHDLSHPHVFVSCLLYPDLVSLSLPSGAHPWPVPGLSFLPLLPGSLLSQALLFHAAPLPLPPPPFPPFLPPPPLP